MTDFTEFAPIFDKFLYGGIASVVAETITFPIDTAKTRLQLQGEFSFFCVFMCSVILKFTYLITLPFTSAEKYKILILIKEGVCKFGF